MGSDHTIATRLRKKSTEQTQYRLQIGGKEFCENLVKHGITSHKAKVMTLPAIPQNYVSDFVRGYFDGDGNVWSGYLHKDRKYPTKSLQVVFTSCSHLFLTSLLHTLHRLGIEKGSVRPHKIRNFSRLRLHTEDSLKIYKMMYNTRTSLFLPRKKKVFELFMRP